MKNVPWLPRLFLPLQQLLLVSVLLLIPNKMRNKTVYFGKYNIRYVTYLFSWLSVDFVKVIVYILDCFISYLFVSVILDYYIEHVSCLFVIDAVHEFYYTACFFTNTVVVMFETDFNHFERCKEIFFRVPMFGKKSRTDFDIDGYRKGSAQTVRAFENLRLLCPDYFFDNFESCISLFRCQYIFFFVSTCLIGSFLGFSCEWSKYFCVIKWCTLNRFYNIYQGFVWISYEQSCKSSQKPLVGCPKNL